MSDLKNQTTYIKELDALRAIAVVGVLLFHLFPQIVTGGFIGVDMFFVISGFVISKSYLYPLLNKDVSIKQFWIKRIRRLMPAYFLVIICTTIAAYILLEPNLLKNYGKSLIGQSFYIQNILFWFEGSYFEGAITKPLLHTWSLGVEEQFYIFFILLILFSKNNAKRFVLILSVIAVISIAIGYVVSNVSPKTSFYLLPMRIWEFYIGILAYLLANKWQIKNSSIMWDILLYFLMLVALTSFFFSNTSAFPGLQSLVACLSVFLIISLLIRLKKINNIVLSNTIVQYIGKLSYSLYLWHWVLISLYVVGLNKELNLQSSSFILVLSFVLSYLSYNYIENPIRRNQLMVSTRNLLSTMIALSIAIVLVGVFLVKSYGAVFRYDEPYKTWLKTAQIKSPYRCGIINRLVNFRSEICKINKVENSDKKGILIIGDSHADQMDEMIARLGEENKVPVYLTVRNCPINKYQNTPHCNKMVFESVLLSIKTLGISKVIAISYWHGEGLSFVNFDNSINSLIESGVELYIAEVTPHDDYFSPKERTKKLLANEKIKTYTLNKYAEQLKLQQSIFKKLQNKHPSKITILKPMSFLCNTKECYFDYEGKPLFFDGNHLSKYGVKRLKPLYESVF